MGYIRFGEKKAMQHSRQYTLKTIVSQSLQGIDFCTYFNNEIHTFLLVSDNTNKGEMQKESCEAITKYISLGGNMKIQELNSLCH